MGVGEGDTEGRDGHQEEEGDPDHLDCHPLDDVDVSAAKYILAVLLSGGGGPPDE